MKKLLTLILVCLTLSVISQSKVEFGITAEGSWFMPAETIEYYLPTNKNGFGTGIGVYASHKIYHGLSADLGLSYRYTEMQQRYDTYTGAGGYSQYPDAKPDQEFMSITGWDKLKMNYLVVPVHLQLLLTKGYFIRGGVEAAWLTNYSVVNEKPEYNWTAGLGSQKHKLKWSVNYIRGFKDQGFGNKTMEADGHYKGAIYRNNMIQVGLSYPLWHVQ
jgi:hypothetical protein